MGFEFQIDEETFLKVLAEKVDFPNEARDGIVGKVAQKASDNIKEKIPVDEGVTKSFWYPSPIRTYVDQSWMTVSFAPKKFGKAGEKDNKGKWIQRKHADELGWGWGWLGMFNRRNKKSYDWLKPAIAHEKSKILRELKQEVKDYYKNR